MIKAAASVGRMSLAEFVQGVDDRRPVKTLKTLVYIIVWIIGMVAVLIFCKLIGLDAYGL